MTGQITLQFCGFKSFFGRLIAWGTQSPLKIGHVDIVMPDGRLCGAQHESGLGGAPAGVQIRPADYGQTCGMINPIRVSFKVSDAQAEKAYLWLNQQIGKPYDTKGILAFIFGWTEARDWRDPSAWFCDELAMAFIEVAGIIKPLVVPNNDITPEGALLVASAVGCVGSIPS